MKCQKCRFDNPDTARFCIECGGPLEFRCPECEAVTPAAGKFCMECGYELAVSDEQQRKEVFAWFGAASYYAQCVEVELWIARLTLVRERNPWPNEHEWQQTESEPLTMGRLVTLVEKGIGLEPSELEALQVCLEKRNWLSHHYWMQRSHLLVSPEGCRQAMEELSELCDLFRKGNEVACAVSARIRARVGISERLIQELQNEYVKRLQSGESHEVVLQDQEQRMKRLSTHIARTGEQDREHENNPTPEG